MAVSGSEEQLLPGYLTQAPVHGVLKVLARVILDPPAVRIALEVHARLAGLGVPQEPQPDLAVPDQAAKHGDQQLGEVALHADVENVTCIGGSVGGLIGRVQILQADAEAFAEL